MKMRRQNVCKYGPTSNTSKNNPILQHAPQAAYKLAVRCPCQESVKARLVVRFSLSYNEVPHPTTLWSRTIS